MKQKSSIFCTRNIKPEHPDYPHDALHVFPLNKDVQLHNDKMLATIPEANIKTFFATDSKKDITGSFEIQPDIKKATDDNGLIGELKLGIGARVMITKNENVEDKIVNGTIGTVVGFSGSGPDTIWVVPDDKSSGLIKRRSLTRAQRKRYPNAIPIKKVEAHISIANDNSSYKRLQFPLKLCWAATIHKYQGRSKDIIVIGGFDRLIGWKAGMLYTALTRCRTAEGLFLLGFRPAVLKANIPGKNEIERIRKKSMISTVHPRINFFDIYPESDWEFLCLQNVRSINMHKLDILSDPIMLRSSIMCLTETALASDDWNGWNDFKSFKIYQKCRRDAHQSSHFNERKSGGVAMLIDKRLESNHLTTNVESLEITNARVLIKNEYVSISLIYKDHKMQKDEFLGKLEKVFQQYKDVPSIILGDFNINTREDSSFVTLIDAHEYVPLVEGSTTINGNLLDQILVRNCSFFDHCDVVTLPAYFSDHDLVVLCIRKN